MWLFANNAFLSIVDPPDRSDVLLVRGRIKGDIERAFPSAKVEETIHRDYRFRALVPRRTVAKAMSDMVMNIDYDNFKNSVQEDSRHSAYAKVWSVMYGFQHSVGGRTLVEVEAERPRPLFTDFSDEFGDDPIASHI